MSAKVCGLIWEVGPQDRMQRFVLLAIGDNAGDDGFCYPGISTIAKKCLFTERYVMQSLQQLEADGWITVARRAHHGKGNEYQINVEKLESLKDELRSAKRFSREKSSRVLSEQSSPDEHSSREIQDTTHVKSKTVSGEIRDIHIRKNRHEPSLESPLPPKGGSEPISKPTMPANADTLVFEIAKLYPRLSHLRIETELNHHVAGLILDAIAKDGPDLVRRGTKAYADSLDKPKFAVRPADFFGEFQYRIHAGNGKPALVSAGDSFLRRNGCL